MGSTVGDAARAVAQGGLVVYPTDTLLGLGASATDPRGRAKLQRVKGRPGGQPVSVALSSLEEIDTWADLGAGARAWVRRHLPGPFTILVRPSARARRLFGPSVVPARGSLGIRVPDHPTAREFARRAGPVSATSANRHGEPTCRTVDQARRAFGAEVAVYLPAVPRPSGRPSRLVDLTGGAPRPLPRR